MQYLDGSFCGHVAANPSKMGGMRPLLLLMCLLGLVLPTAHAQNSFNLRFGSAFHFEGDFAVSDSVDIIVGLGLLPILPIIDSVNLGASYRLTPDPSHFFARARAMWLPVSLPGRLGGLMTGGYRYAFGGFHLEGELGVGVNDGVYDSEGPFVGVALRLSAGIPLSP